MVEAVGACMKRVGSSSSRGRGRAPSLLLARSTQQPLALLAGLGKGMVGAVAGSMRRSGSRSRRAASCEQVAFNVGLVAGTLFVAT